jgi:hypothetical protein
MTAQVMRTPRLWFGRLLLTPLVCTANSSLTPLLPRSQSGLPL